MKKTVLILHPSKFNNIRFKKYELVNYTKMGYEIIIHDLTKLYFPEIDHTKLYSDSKYTNEIHLINSLNDWTKHLKEINEKYNSILILNFTLEHINIKNIFIYKTLGVNLNPLKTQKNFL